MSASNADKERALDQGWVARNRPSHCVSLQTLMQGQDPKKPLKAAVMCANVKLGEGLLVTCLARLSDDDRAQYYAKEESMRKLFIPKLGCHILVEPHLVDLLEAVVISISDKLYQAWLTGYEQRCGDDGKFAFLLMDRSPEGKYVMLPYDNIIGKVFWDARQAVVPLTDWKRVELELADCVRESPTNKLSMLGHVRYFHHGARMVLVERWKHFASNDPARYKAYYQHEIERISHIDGQKEMSKAFRGSDLSRDVLFTGYRNPTVQAPTVLKINDESSEASGVSQQQPSAEPQPSSSQSLLLDQDLGDFFYSLPLPASLFHKFEQIELRLAMGECSNKSLEEAFGKAFDSLHSLALSSAVASQTQRRLETFYNKMKENDSVALAQQLGRADSSPAEAECARSSGDGGDRKRRRASSNLSSSGDDTVKLEGEDEKGSGESNDSDKMFSDSSSSDDCRQLQFGMDDVSLMLRGENTIDVCPDTGVAKGHVVRRTDIDHFDTFLALSVHSSKGRVVAKLHGLFSDSPDMRDTMHLEIVLKTKADVAIFTQDTGRVEAGEHVLYLPPNNSGRIRYGRLLCGVDANAFVGLLHNQYQFDVHSVPVNCLSAAVDMENGEPDHLDMPVARVMEVGEGTDEQ